MTTTINRLVIPKKFLSKYRTCTVIPMLKIVREYSNMYLVVQLTQNCLMFVYLMIQLKGQFMHYKQRQRKLLVNPIVLIVP